MAIEPHIVRQCSPCTACLTAYTLHEAPESRSPRITFAGQSVMKYSVCESAGCEWFRGYGREQDRPDRSGVVIDLRSLALFAGYPTHFLWLQKQFDRVYAERTLQHSLCRGFMACVVYANRTMYLYVPDFIQLRRRVEEWIIEEGTQIRSAGDVLNTMDIRTSSEWLVGKYTDKTRTLVQGGLSYEEAVLLMGNTIRSCGPRSCWMTAYSKGQLSSMIRPMDMVKGITPLI